MQNRVQPTASDSSDPLFFMRKMRCEGTRFGVKISKRRYAAAGATRHARVRSAKIYSGRGVAARGKTGLNRD